MNDSTTELAVIAWIPTSDEHLTIAGVHAIGGQIIDDEPVSYCTATARAFTLSQETSQSQGHYIPVYLRKGFDVKASVLLSERLVDSTQK